MRNESVFCACCGREFEIRLFALVRVRSPVWCSECVSKADEELEKARERAKRYSETAGRG